MNAVTEAMAEFLAAIEDAGLEFDGPFRTDGKLSRHHVRGDKPGTTNGWAQLTFTAAGAFGSFGTWRGGIKRTWHSGGASMTPLQRAELRKAMEDAEREAREERDRRQAWAARGARRDWNRASPASPSHGYLLHKHVQPHGLRQVPSRKDRHRTLLVMPLCDVDGAIWSLQFIDADGGKRFLPGGRKRGLFYMIGGPIVDHVQIAEGFATAASLYEANGVPTVAAMDCGNLRPVAEAIRGKHPHADLVLYADNDTGTPGNPGLTQARAAALAVGGVVFVPPEGFNDFNDVDVARKTGACRA